MSELLQNPAIQAAVAPFVIALIASLVLHNTRLGAWVIGAGFLSMAALATGLTINFESLTSFSKLLLVSAAGLVLIPLSQFAIRHTLLRQALLALLAGLGAVWMGWRVIQQAEDTQRLLLIAGAFAYAALLMLNAMLHNRDSITSNAGAIAMGVATGGVALLGASITLSFTGIAVAVASGAYLLTQLLRGKSPDNNTLAEQAALVCALAGLSAVLTGQLKWYALLPILLIPLATQISRPAERPPLLAAIASGIAALIPALLAVGLAWWSGSGPSQ